MVHALAGKFTVLAIREERTGAITFTATPANVTDTFARPGMAHFSVFHFTFTGGVTVQAIFVIGTGSVAAIGTSPSRLAYTLSCCWIAGSIVLAQAIFGTIAPEFIVRTLIETLFANKPRWTFTLAGYMMARCLAEALTIQFAVLSIGAIRTAVRTHLPNPAGRTLAFATVRITFAIVLATTVLFTLSTVLTIWTLVLT